MEWRTIQAFIRHMAAAVDAAPAFDRPFRHLVLDRVFPDDVYAAMLEMMPTGADYRALPGRHKENIRGDGSATRVKIDLFPEYTRHLPPAQRAFWSGIGQALCSDEDDVGLKRDRLVGQADAYRSIEDLTEWM